MANIPQNDKDIEEAYGIYMLDKEQESEIDCSMCHVMKTYCTCRIRRGTQHCYDARMDRL